MIISETERRENHISRIDPNHVLLPVALDCLKDMDVECPSAQQLCERIATLKEGFKYGESVSSNAERGREHVQQVQSSWIRW